MRMFKPMTEKEYIKFRAHLVEAKEEAIEKQDRLTINLLKTFIDNLDFYQKGEETVDYNNF